MKKLILMGVIAALGGLTGVVSAQNRIVKGKGGDAEKRLRAIEDRNALRDLVDEFSNLADKKDVASQLLLFTPDATIDIFINRKPSGKLNGRKEIENSFVPFLSNFDIVYHFNGQHSVKLNGDTATGILYCTVTLIGQENGKTMKTTFGISYNDEYVRTDGKWLIRKRVSNFNWQDKRELGQ